MKFLIVPVLLLAAQTTHPVAKPEPKVPVISDAIQKKFFKAQSEMQAASDQAKQAAQNAQLKQVALQAAIKDVQDSCGKDFVPQIDKDGDPACVAKPAPEKDAEPKK